MPNPQISDLAAIAKLADSKLVQQVYSDGLQPGTTELGQLAGEVTKTTRMLLQPLFTGLQGAAKRLDNWIAEAVKDVPPHRLIAPKPALLKPVLEAIGVQGDDSEMRSYYITLLKNMMDTEHRAEVHPAFPRLLQDLSPIEALLLQITGPGVEVDIPSGVASPPYHLEAGLLTTWETRKESNNSGGRYRFFRQVSKWHPGYPQDGIVFGKHSDHAGFLEISVAQDVLIRDRGLGWLNLERLQLVKKLDSPKVVNGRIEGAFTHDMPACSQLQKLLPKASPHAGDMYYRTELGQVFARSCTPRFFGECLWHTVVEG